MRKHTVLKDELNIKGGGIYCYLPFGNVDTHNKAIFKVGIARNFNNRTENYHTYFPLGVYFLAFLEEPPPEKQTRKTKGNTRLQQFIKVEKFIFNYLVENGAKRIHSTTRIIHPNEDKEGSSEWFYCSEHLIHEAFSKAKKIFGGKLELYYLKGTDAETGKYTSINDQFRADQRHKPNYVGKIVFFV